MLDDLKNLKLDNPDAQKQMEGMLARLNVIRDQHLGPRRSGNLAGRKIAGRRCSPSA